MAAKAVLFDLDGTLADTALDLGGALNRLLHRHGLPAKSMGEIRPTASHGAAGLLLLGAGIGRSHPDYARWRAEYLAEYEHCFDQETVLFGQTVPLLDGLAKAGVVWGIVTNKPKTFTDRLVPKLGFPSPPAVVVSGDTCREAKPSPMPLLYACSQIGAEAHECLYVGDAERDMQAGRAAGMKTVLAQWGYISPADQTENWPADFSARQPLDVLKYI
ncbi:MAG: HAD family hydrolase [Neisseria sp.]|nr:HAD family hydrolase [Neisseria sp.]